MNSVASGSHFGVYDQVERAGVSVARGDSDHDLIAADERLPRAEMRRAHTGPVAAQAPAGMIERYGYHEGAGGWFVCGWMLHQESAEAIRDVVMRFGTERVGGRPLVWCHKRADLKDGAVGVVLFVKVSAVESGEPLAGIDIVSDSGPCSLPSWDALEHLSGVTLAAWVQSFAAEVFPLAARRLLLRKLAAQPYNGTNTLTSLNDWVQMHVDDAIVCPPYGIVLKGWLLAMPGAVRAIRVRSGRNAATVDLKKSPKIARPDVIQSVGTPFGVSDSRCGFVVYVPDAIIANSDLYLEIEVSGHETGFCPVPKPRTTGLDAIQRILSDIDSFSGNLSAVFESGIGHAIARINKARLERGCAVTSQVFGKPVPSPLCSLIIPLHRRIDFAEYQMAFFSQHEEFHHEIIYVVDDPPRATETRILFASIYERFRLPFRALFLEHNMGFAAASNIGLREARGKYVCFFNSDVMPGDQGWAERLVARLTANPELGAIGPRLLYDDGSVQHEGMNFMQIPEFDDWFFCDHPRKGMKGSAAAGLRKCVAVTGACLMMKRSLANEMNGFDEDFIVGDFEDSDLCLRLNARGLSVGVDLNETLFHLERQSQVAPAERWRLNLTLYNAWIHQKRWAQRIRALARQPAGPGTLGVMRSSVLDKTGRRG